ncbi:LCP family protein [Planococcus salinus]|uniref:LytR family transcriptional regulator n=1 Tax=Planococcus salinus TaxID=1848460 RepID=A0A3M8P4K9_9BACL|nr:LCP family protein [Planococcus salinus]RNF38290.1 LytR family transcriptional regulator [Planococcus salinus]
MSPKSPSADKKRTIIIILIAVTVTLLLSVSVYAVYLLKKVETAADNAYEDATGREMSQFREKQVEPLHDNISVLFIGIDNSEKRNQDQEDTLSDALILATLNNEEKSVKLVSIPRDTYTYIPDAGFEDKITHAYGYNGAVSTIESVEELLEVPVDYYVRMDFEAFIEVVDALGGIEVDVPYDLSEKDENDVANAIVLEEGIQTLNGREALALARTRIYDNDIERGKRQQMILEAIMDEILSVSSFMKYGRVIDAVSDHMKTDLTYDDMRSFLEYGKDGEPDIENITLAGYDDMSTGVYYWQLDQNALSETKETLQDHLELNEETKPAEQTESEAAETTEDNQ